MVEFTTLDNGWEVRPGTGYPHRFTLSLPWVRLRHYPAMCGSSSPTYGYHCTRPVLHGARRCASLPIHTGNGYRIVIAVWH